MTNNAPASKKIRVLVLDDEAAIAELLTEMLKILGYDVSPCLRPREALELLGRESFDLVLSDFRMPEMNGKAFHGEVQAMNPALARRIIFLTGDTVNDETQLFLQTTGNPHISKPFQFTNIQQVLKDTLAQPATGSLAGQS